MIMFAIYILALVAMVVFTIIWNSRYCFKSSSQRWFTTAQLSPEFRAQFAQQLALCDIPCKKIIQSAPSRILGGSDNRPIISAAGELLIDEERCATLAPDVFAAGLEYELAQVQSNFCWYSMVLAVISIISFGPLVHGLNIVVQNFLTTHTTGFLPALMYLPAVLIRFIDTWLLVQLFIIFGLNALLEVVMTQWSVHAIFNSGEYSGSLIDYFAYQETYITAGLDQTFLISRMRKYLEKLQRNETSE